MITAFNTYSETRLYFPCPNCKKNNELGLLAFLSAVNRHKEIWCVHCQVDYYIELNCLTRDAYPAPRSAANKINCSSIKSHGRHSLAPFDIPLDASSYIPKGRCFWCGSPAQYKSLPNTV